jgi:hypothetical protein
MFLVLEIHQDNFLVVADSYQQHLYQVPLNNGGTNALVTSKLYRPIAVAFDPITQKVHWTDNDAKVVKSAYLSGKSDIVFLINDDHAEMLVTACQELYQYICEQFVAHLFSFSCCVFVLSCLFSSCVLCAQC